jgi:calcineurin-like phosphoesterase family protein
MPDLFFTADEHFDHLNIMRHCKRPFLTVDDMNAQLVKNWNDVVPKDGIVYIIGDFAWKRHLHWLMALNGKKILVIGNHDRASQDVYRQFTEVHYGWLCREINGRLVFMNHFPQDSWWGSFRGSWHLFGHCHGRMPEKKLIRCDVGVDVWHYTPIPWEVLVKKMEWMTEERKAYLATSPVGEEELDLRVNDMRKLNERFITEAGYSFSEKRLLLAEGTRPA